MGLRKPIQHTTFEVASFSRFKNIKRELARFSSAWDFMMGLGKLQRFAKFEGAGFIFYGNI